jgi:two-component system CheB/CheR fusion protein
MSEPFRVLVVEDNKDAANSLRVLLQLLGHEVHVAFTGPEGIAAAHAYLPDLVLCDLGLPGCSGWEVARQVHKDPATATTRFVAFTGYDTHEDRRRSAEAGFEAHYAKPVEVNDILSVLTRKRTA